jgi:hypothetical protein
MLFLQIKKIGIMLCLLNNICLPIIYFVHSSVCFIVCFLHFLKISIIFFYRWDFWFAGAYLWAQFIPTYLRLFVRLFVRSFVCSFVCLFVRLFVCSLVRLFVRLLVCSFVCSFVRSFVRSCTLNIINILGFGIKARTPPQNYMHYTHAIIVVEKEIGIGCLNYWGVFYCCSDDRGNVGRQCITFNSYSRFVLYNKRLSKHKPKKILLWNNWLCESSIVVC